MANQPTQVSDATRRDAGLSDSDLWFRYFELGGMQTPVEIASYVHDGVGLSVHDHDVLAQALNERFSELGRDCRVQYVGEPKHEPSSQPEALEGVDLGLLGGFSLRINGEPVHVPMDAQRLVCFLALQSGTLLRRHVSGSLWGETTASRSLGSLRSALWRLGQSSPALVEAVDCHLRLSPHVAVDLHASAALARRILDDQQELSDVDMDAMLLSTDLLPDWTDEWVLVERNHHTELRIRALEALCRRLRTMGRFSQAVRAGMLAIAAEPLRESAHCALLEAHVAEGNIPAATKQYEAFGELLWAEMNLEPSPELQALARGMRP